MPGSCAITQSATLSLGFNVANRALTSPPPPLAATITSSSSPSTISLKTIAGVLSRVLDRLPSGSRTMEARSGLTGSV